MNINGLYSFEMQRSIDHPALNNLDARRHGMLTAAFRQNSKSTLTVDGNYDRTDTAGDLNFMTGLLLERRRAQRWQVGPSIGLSSGSADDHLGGLHLDERGHRTELQPRTSTSCALT